MSKPLHINIKESISELRALQRKSGQLISNRIEVLIVIKQHEKQGGISKRGLSAKTGVNHNSIVKWRKMYLSGGIESLLKHGRVGFKPSLISKGEHKQLESRLKDPKNNLQGYTELLQWTKTMWNKDLNYTTLYEYCRRNFGSKIKTARKSHIKKDEKAVEAFKKTSVEKSKK